MNLLQTKYFFPLLCAVAAFSYFILQPAPSYTKWAVILLILPSIFFLFRKESTLDRKKLFIILVIALVMGMIWDTIAINLEIWGFPRQNVLGWFLGIPLEEYIFAVSFVVITLGIYTSLPHFRQSVYDGPRLKEIPLLCLVFSIQLIVWSTLLYSNAQSYIKWLLFLAIPPSLFYLWRTGEKIDEMRMFLTAGMLAIMTLAMDVIFTRANSWFHYDVALLGRIGIVPIDDILFSVFIGVSIVGFYTSLPYKHLFTGKW